MLPHIADRFQKQLLFLLRITVKIILSLFNLFFADTHYTDNDEKVANIVHLF